MGATSFDNTLTVVGGEFLGEVSERLKAFEATCPNDALAILRSLIVSPEPFRPKIPSAVSKAFKELRQSLPEGIAIAKGYERDWPGCVYALFHAAHIHRMESLVLETKSRCRSRKVNNAFLVALGSRLEVVDGPADQAVYVQRIGTHCTTVLKREHTYNIVATGHIKGEGAPLQDVVTKILAEAFGLEDESLYIWEKQEQTRSEITEIIEKVNSFNRRDEYSDNDFEHVTIAFHVSPGDQPITNFDRDRVRFIAVRNFQPYSEVPMLDPTRKFVLLVSEELQLLVRHRFSLEPVGEFQLQRSLGLASVIYNVWCSKRSGSDDARQYDAILDTLESADTANVNIDPRLYASGSPLSCQDFSRQLLFAIEERYGANALILHWQCTSERSTDLLRPFDESIGYLMRLNRRSEFADQASRNETPINISEVVDQLLERKAGEDVATKIRDSITRLLVGGGSESDFASIVEDAKTLLKELSYGRLLRIVVEGIEFADELLLEIIKSLPKRFGREGDGIRIYCVGSGDSCAEPPARSAKISRDAVRMLRIAAILGSDFRWKWLLDCWGEESCDLTRLGFRRILNECLEAGVLEFCDSLIDGQGNNRFLRQMKWVSRAEHEFYKSCCDATEAKAIVNYLWRSLSYFVDADGTRRNIVPDILRVRLRTRIFDLLSSWGGDEPSLQSFVSELGLFLGKRASNAGAISEAERRLDIAIRVWKLIPTHDHRHRKTGYDLAYQRIRLWATRREYPQEPRPLDLQFARGLLQQTLDASEIDKPRALKRFRFARLIWSAENWSEHLQLADEHSKLMLSLASHCDAAVLLEARHARAVTLFAMGRLQECKDEAELGARYCLENESAEHPDPELFGSHDGRVCCKVFAALGDLLLTGQDSQSWMAKAIEFASEKGNYETRRIAFSYSAIAQILQESFDVAIEKCRRANQWATKQQWCLLTDLISDCASIGKSFANSVRGDDLLLSIVSHREKWQVNEYETLWMTFEGVASWLADRDFPKPFQAAIELGGCRGENVFLPLCYLWWGRVLLRSGNQRGAIECWRSGLERAEALNSLHYRKCLTAELAKAGQCP